MKEYEERQSQLARYVHQNWNFSYGLNELGVAPFRGVISGVSPIVSKADDWLEGYRDSDSVQRDSGAFGDDHASRPCMLWEKYVEW